VTEAVDACVAQQVEAGIDLVSDGEMSKITYVTYVKERLSGFDGDSAPPLPADYEQFPGLLQKAAVADHGSRLSAGRAVSARSRRCRVTASATTSVGSRRPWPGIQPMGRS
jgi:hypothetical protein